MEAVETSRRISRPTVSVRIQNLEVEFDRFHIERHVLFGFPPHQLTCLRLFDAFDRDLFDDHIATADGRHELFRLDPGRLKRLANGICDDRVVHHFTFNDGGIVEWCDDHLRQFRDAARVVHDDRFHESGSDIKTDGQFLSTEERHGFLGLRCGGRALLCVRRVRTPEHVDRSEMDVSHF